MLLKLRRKDMKIEYISLERFLKKRQRRFQAFRFKQVNKKILK